MIAPRWRKVLSDVWTSKVRTLLVILSIGIGVFAVGVVSSMYFIMDKDLNDGYLASNPHHAILFTTPFDDTLLESVRRMDGVAAAEGRSTIGVNLIGKNGEKIPLNITAIPPIKKMKMDLIQPVNPAGEIPLEDHGLLLERSVLAVLPVKPGDMVQVEIGQGKVRDIKVTGIVYDVGVESYSFTHQVSGFVTPNTMENLGGSLQWTQIDLTVAEHGSDEAHVKEVASGVADKLQKGGRQIFFTLVFRPGENPARPAIQAVMGLLGGFGALLVFLSAFLVVNTITALLSQQIRQIGMMKAIGATTRQMVAMYLVLVLTFGLLALIIFGPLAAYAGYALAGVLAQLLNGNLAGFRVPQATLVLMLIVGLGIPFIAALLPVLGGSRVSVREAITNYGLGGSAKEAGRGRQRLLFFQVWLSRLFSPPTMISLRNTFRRKGRLALTLSTLTLGGAIFIAVFNLRASLSVEIDKTLGYFLSDLNISLNHPYRIELIEPILRSLPNIARVEGWAFDSANLYTPDKKASLQVQIIAPPSDSQLIRPTLISGRWLVPGDQNAIVIGNHLLQKRPDLKTGDDIVMRLQGQDKDTTWHVVGVFVMAGNVVSPILFSSQEYINQVRDQVGRVSQFRVVTNPRDRITQTRVATQVQEAFKQAGIQVGSVQTGAEITDQQSTAINIIIYMLLGMAVLIAVVGGIGLMGTMSMNVMERTREIGVMRAIGATDWSILGLVILEGMLIGIISWVLGILLAVPISKLLGDIVGLSLLTVPIGLVISPDGFLIWLIFVIALSALASLLPALNAVRLTVREVLAYE